MFGYQGRWVFVDLTTRSVRIEPARAEIYRDYLGGRGVQAWLMHEHLHATGPVPDPFSPQNRIVIGSSALNDTRLPTAGRGSCSFISPMTRSVEASAWVPMHRPVWGLLTHSSAGGTFPNALKRAGIDQLVIDGCADRPVRLHASDGTVQVIDAEDDLFDRGGSRPIVGTSSAVTDRLELYHPGCSAACAGPAGWNRVPFACLTNDHHRNFGRGGAGAVFGSKRLVSVSASGRLPVRHADSETFDRLAQEIDALIEAHANDPARTASFRPATGTTWWLDRAFDGRFLGQQGGYLPFWNFDEGTFDPLQFERVSTEAFAELAGRHQVCNRCRHLTCTRSARVERGPYAGEGVRPEFETIALWINCGVFDREAIFHANRRCNDLGIDTMSFGSVLAAAMELNEGGRLRNFEHPPSFGSAADLVRTLNEVASRSTDLGRLLGQTGDEIIGALASARSEFEVAAIARSVTFAYGGLGYAGVEPKAFPGMFTAYSSSNRGRGDHNAAWTVQAEESGLAGPGPLGGFVASAQSRKALVDSLGLCDFFTADLLSDQFLSLYRALTGIDHTPASLEECGRRIFTLERHVNTLQGRTRGYDAFIPQKMTEPLRVGPFRGRAVDPSFHGAALDALYAHHGWSGDGTVAASTLANLGIVC